MNDTPNAPDPQNASSSKPWEHAKSSGSETDPVAARFVASLDWDWRLYTHDIAGSIAHARMLQHVGLITERDLAEIERGLREIEAEIDALGANGRQWPGFKVELEDVHMCVEAALIEKVGEPGKKLHTGRSRNDQVATDVALWINEARGLINAKLLVIRRALLGLAERDGHIVMPSYTHLQRAQPVVVGGELLAWFEAITKCESRCEMSFEYELPLGSGAIAGSSLPLDRKHTQRHLSSMTEGLSRNAIQATASRDATIDFVYALSMTSMWLSRWAEQWIIYASAEFGFITLGDAYTTGSSMMPQKRNPDMLELIRGKAGQVYGSLMALLTLCKGITIGYNRDLQEDKRHLFSAYDCVCDCLDIAAGIVRTTTFNKDRIADGLDRGYLDATSLAEYLVTKGVPFRTAHQVVGALVHQCDSSGRYKLEQLTLDEMNAVLAEKYPPESSSSGAKPVAIGEDVFDWLGPANVVKRYQSAGNAGLTGFEQQLAAWKQRLGEED